MKIASHSNSLETNTEVKSQDFGIGNASKIIGILRNFLYEHKVRTMVQEYMSNARDAMREVKSTKRIVVTVPNSMNPVFKVRDFGPGITPSRMKNVFTQYGESTKDKSNNQTGGFGIGAKSAWAYTDSFTIVSITGGVKRTYVAHTGVNNQGRLDLISEEETTEPQGAEIHVAVKSGDLSEFRNSIWRACHFWTPEEYPDFKGVVAHEVPVRKPTIKVGELELSTDLPNYLGVDYNHYGDYCSLVIDGIPYKLGKSFIQNTKELQRLIQKIKCQAFIHLGNGMVEIPATRESVADTDLNKEVLNRLVPNIAKGLAKYVKSEFEKAKTYSEWLAAYNTMSKIMNVDDHATRGDYKIYNEGLTSKLFTDFEVYECTTGTKALVKRAGASSIRLDSMAHIIYVDTPDEFMVTQNRRLKEYIEGSGSRRCILFMAKEQFEMVSGTAAGVGTNTPGTLPAMVKKITLTLTASKKAMDKVIADLGAKKLSILPFTVPVRVPRAARIKEKEEFTVHLHTSWRKRPFQTTLEKIELDKEKYLYVPFKEYDKYSAEFSEMKEFCEGLGYELCALSPATIKTVAGHKQFRPYQNWRDHYAPDAKLVKQLMYNVAKNTNEMNWLSKASTKIADPVVVSMMDMYKDLLKIDSTDTSVPKAISDMVSKEVKAFEKDDAELTKHLRKTYPLLGRLSSPVDKTIADELVAYMNAKV